MLDRHHYGDDFLSCSAVSEINGYWKGMSLSKIKSAERAKVQLFQRIF